MGGGGVTLRYDRAQDVWTFETAGTVRALKEPHGLASGRQTGSEMRTGLRVPDPPVEYVGYRVTAQLTSATSSRRLRSVPGPSTSPRRLRNAMKTIAKPCCDLCGASKAQPRSAHAISADTARGKGAVRQVRANPRTA